MADNRLLSGAVIQPSIVARDVDPHEDVFLARYIRLHAWALQLTENDRERAEDLVHDAYIQFTFARPDLDSIQNLNGYLYRMLRNLHLSRVRRSQRRLFRTLSVVDYDSAEVGLRAADPRERISVQDQLREVCQYACLRKQTSKAGSVLILRFMHGYYPREIARVMQCSREAVEERLRLARNEAKQYLENPASLRFIGDPAREKISISGGFARTVDEFLVELRRTIFDSRKGECLTAAQFEALYQAAAPAKIKHLTLAHIVSCHTCLDEVNRRLSLPSLAERFPTDTLGTDTRPKDGDGSGDGGGSSVGGSEIDRQRCRKAARDVLEHRPSQLSVSVNGYLMATQNIGSAISEQIIAINIAEEIGFVEVFSEQRVRLLFIDVEENRGADRRARIGLSDDRTLEANLKFDNPWPTLQVLYSDPSLAGTDAIEANIPRRIAPAAAVAGSKTGQNFRLLFERLPGWFAGLRFLLRPGTLTAAISLLLIGALLLMRLYGPTASASEILRRSALAEEAMASERGTVVHRSISLEERSLDSSAATVRHRIEIWQSGSRRLKLRRLFDDQNRLIAGDWANADGTSMVYRNGSSPQPRTAPEVAPKAVVENAEFWRLDPSACAFGMLIDRPEAITIEENSETYVLAFENQAAGSNRLLSGSLTVAKAGLRATEQKLVVSRNGIQREYRFTETVFEKKADADVPAQVFEPETHLSSRAADRPNQALRSTGEGESAVGQPSEAVASPELEIEVTYLLNRIKADLGEQISLSRTASGALRVEALAENEQRKTEILRALGPVRNNPAVKVDVSTVAEAVKRQPERSNSTTTRDVEVANNPIPADAELRAYFAGRLVGREGIDAEINNYTNRVMGRSRRALLHASALKKLVTRFSPQDLRGLAPDARTKWLGMIHEHALGCQREVASLRQELRMVFGGSGESGGENVTEASLPQAAGRLVELSYGNDEAVRSAFTVSSEGKGAAAIKSNQFWLTLSSAERLAAAIDRIYSNSP